MSTTGSGMRRRTPTRIPATSARTGRAQPAGANRARSEWRRRRAGLPLLVGITLVCSLTMVGVGFASARAAAIGSAQAATARNLAVVREVIAEQGPSIIMRDNRLVVGVDTRGVVLNNDTTAVDHASALTGSSVIIYELEGPNLTAIASNLPRSDGRGQAIAHSRALGDDLSGAAYAALLGNCGPVSTTTCHQSYSGGVALSGASYVASFAPLTDPSGNFIGALAVAQPLTTVLTGAQQLLIVLLLVALLAILIALVAGAWLFGGSASGDEPAAARAAQRDAVADAARALEQLAGNQAARGQRHERLVQQIGAETREFDLLAVALEQDRAELSDSTAEIWAEVSQPGVPNPAVAMRLARQVAVMAAGNGASASAASERCRRLVGVLQQMIADGHAGSDDDRQIAQRLADVCAALEQAGYAAGQPRSGQSVLARLRPGGRTPASAPARGGTGQLAAIRPISQPARAPQTGGTATGYRRSVNPTSGAPGASGNTSAIAPPSRPPYAGNAGTGGLRGSTGMHRVPRGGKPNAPREAPRQAPRGRDGGDPGASGAAWMND